MASYASPAMHDPHQHKEKHEYTIKIDDDEPAVFNLAGKETGRSLASVNIIWKNPKNPLTFVIETLYTEQQKPFHLGSYGKPNAWAPKIYQLVNGQEVEKDTNQPTVWYSCDSNYRVVLKMIPGENPPESYTFDYSPIPA